MQAENLAVFAFLLANALPVEWRRFESIKTPFGTDVDPSRNDVLVAFVTKDNPLPSAPIVDEVAPTFGDREPIISATLSLALIIPEEFDKYELDMWRRGHLPVFKIL